METIGKNHFHEFWCFGLSESPLRSQFQKSWKLWKLLVLPKFSMNLVAKIEAIGTTNNFHEFGVLKSPNLRSARHLSRKHSKTVGQREGVPYIYIYVHLFICLLYWYTCTCIHSITHLQIDKVERQKDGLMDGHVCALYVCVKKPLQ